MKMGLAILGLMDAILLVGCMNCAEAWIEEPKVMHVGGNVLCQDCTSGWNEWSQGAKPIKGARVCITCMDERSRVMYYGSDETDERGEFNMIIDKYNHGKELKPKLCAVRLISSPHPVYNILTDFAGGRSGVKLNRPSLVYRDLVKYTLGPFYFTSPMCDEPDSTESFDDQGSNY